MGAIAKSFEPMRQTAAAAVVADWRRWWWVFVLAAGAEAALLGTVATRRAVNADEGFYLAAAQQVLAGRHLYGDHFFPQMPYLPYAEAAVLAFSGPSLLAGRFLSVAAGALLAGILVVTAARRSGALRVGVAMGLLYAGNALLLSYVPIAKPYAFANLTLVGGFLLLVAPVVSPARACAAGVCAGLAVGFRLPAAAAVLVLLAWSMRHGTRQVLAFGVGTILAASLWLWLAARDPQS